MPRIQMTRTVKIALYLLPLYLLVLLGLIALKFVRVFTSETGKPAPAVHTTPEPGNAPR